MIPVLFTIVLFSGCGVALWKGHFSERMIAVALLTGAFVSPLVETAAFAFPEVGVLAVDSALFVLLLGLALVSDRFWPMWAAGFQIVGTLIHVARFVDASIWPKAYITAEAFWAYPVLAALGFGTWFEARHRDA